MLVTRIIILFSACLLLSGNAGLNGQFISEKKLGKLDNNLIRKDVGLKYIYTFPLERTEVKRTGAGEHIEIPVYRNQELIGVLMNRVLDGSVTVYDPNYYGPVSGLNSKHAVQAIDTGRILRYMNAGRDTSYLLDEKGNISVIKEYNQPVLTEISGLFFLENWFLNIEQGIFQKEVVAYLPIRDYYTPGETGNYPVRNRRLLFMVIPSRAVPDKHSSRSGLKDYELIYTELDYEIELYNRPYSDYIYREELNRQISQPEYEKWEYHHFDFFRELDRNRFISLLKDAVLRGHLEAGRAVAENGQSGTEDYPDILAKVPEDEINSIIFHEDWYLRPEDLKLVKVIEGITLVRHYREYDPYTKEFLRTRKDPLIRIGFKTNSR